MPVTGPRRRLKHAVLALTLIAMAAPAAVSAATSLSFGTVSVGATKSLDATLPLTSALSNLPSSTELYGGGNGSINTALALAGLPVPLTAGALLAAAGDITATYHLSGNLATGSDFSIDAATCLTATVSCQASVTFMPTEVGSLTDSISWSISDLQVTGGGSLASLIQLMAPFLASSFAAQLAISLDGIGVPSIGSVSAQVEIAASAACIELTTSTIDFGNLTLGAEDQPSTPTITATNCSGASETLYARGTDATGPSASWALVDSSATCAGSLGLDNYRLNLASPGLPAALGLSTVNKTVQSLAAGENADYVARIFTACPGSTGAGVVMTMQVHYLVLGD